MKGFNRNDLEFSLCGLNCSLCTMKLDNYCPGCGGGAGNQGCSIARCSLQYQGVEYCFQCEEYPCEKYNSIDEFDSFITHRGQLKDMERAQKLGIGQYHLELAEKAEILTYQLENFNDGRRKSLFCIAVNLLDIHDIREIMKQIDAQTSLGNLTLKEKSNIVASLFQNVAQKNNIILKLKKKPTKK
ncbi:MAG: DUF3795 domain-containing protein [Desulfotomaculaceae bacterium]|nr:DUF3795 domain-containing protein [Desulfotomaculaceae bacterium]